VEKGECVKFTVNRQKVFGRVVVFEVKGGLAGDDEKYYGSKVEVHFARIPAVVFGKKPTVESKPISCIDLSSNNSHLVRDEELNALALEMPKSVRLGLIETGTSMRQFSSYANDLVLQSGEKYYGLSVQLINAKGNLVVCPPQSAREKFTVRFQVTDFRDFGKSRELWEWKEKEKKYKTAPFPKDKDGFERAFFGFWEVQLSQAGMFGGTVSVYADSDRLVLEAPVTVQVNNNLVDTV
jgi:hypothetical protein